MLTLIIHKLPYWSWSDKSDFLANVFWAAVLAFDIPKKTYVSFKILFVLPSWRCNHPKQDSSFQMSIAFLHWRSLRSILNKTCTYLHGKLHLWHMRSCKPVGSMTQAAILAQNNDSNLWDMFRSHCREYTERIYGHGLAMTYLEEYQLKWISPQHGSIQQLQVR